MRWMNYVTLCALAAPASADVIWTGSAGADVFQNANWDFTSSPVSSVSANVAIDDDVRILGAATPVEIPDVGGSQQQRLELAAGRTLTLDGSTLMAVGNDGVGAAGAGGRVEVLGASLFAPTFVVGGLRVEVDGTSTARLLGGGNPINGSTVDLAAGAVLELPAETVSAFLSEHLGKVTVAGQAAVVGVNLAVVSDGASGCIVTTITSVVTDADDDLLSDDDETNVHLTDPMNPDTDGDGTPDGLEVARGLDPLDPASHLDRPNVVFVLCDDLGYGDLGVLFQNAVVGPKRLHTPNLDRLAGEGVLLTRHYCPAAVCAPSRASLMHGVHQGHANIRNNQFDKALAPNHNLATVLSRAGYSTALIGKWGLQGAGNSPAAWPAYPTKVGFDEFYGYVRHGDGHTHYPAHVTAARPRKELYDGPNEISADLDGCYTADLFTARAKKYIVDAQTLAPERPFFVLLAYDTPHAALHVPTQAYPSGSGLAGGVQWLGVPGQMINTAATPIDAWIHPDYRGLGWTEAEERFATVVRRLDDTIGDLAQTLDDLGIGDDTLLIVTSDNGPHTEAYTPGLTYRANMFDSFGPLDGIKRDAWEGGIRMPTIARWPGSIPAGRVDATPSQFHDWLSTLSGLAGWEPPSRSDGVSLEPILRGTGAREEGVVYVEYSSGSSTPNYPEFEASRRGRQRGQEQVVFLDGYKGVRVGVQSHADRFEIYDVLADPGEANDLASSSGYFVSLEARMRDRVLRLRRPDASAARPYDNELVPAAVTGPIENGLRVAAFEGLWPWVPDFGRMPSVAEFDAPGPDVASHLTRAVDAGLRYTGYLEVPAAGTWTLSVATDTGAILRLHQATILDDDYRHSGVTISGSVRLTAGLHPIAIDYRTAIQASDLTLTWSGPGVPEEPIPLARFWRDDRSIGGLVCIGEPNSVGPGATMRLLGTPLIAANDVRLEASSLPPNSFGYFLTARMSGFVIGPGGSQGNLCLGGASIGRYVASDEIQFSGPIGVFGLNVDLTRIPTPLGFVAAQPGETRIFQAWYRDANPLPTSNFTAARSVTLF